MFCAEINAIDNHETTRLQPHPKMNHDGWRELIGFPTPSGYKGVGKPTMDAQLCLWEAACGYSCLNRCNIGNKCDVVEGGISCYQATRVRKEGRVTNH